MIQAQARLEPGYLGDSVIYKVEKTTYRLGNLQRYRQLYVF